MSDSTASVSRRQLLHGIAGASLGLVLAHDAAAQLPRESADAGFRVKQGRIRQSVMGWCFNPMKPEVLAKHCKEIGLVAIEGISRDAYKAAKEIGLEISLVGSHGFAQGPCNPKFKDEVIAKLTDAIDVAKAIGSQRVITFTGMRFEGMDETKAANDCIEVWKKVLPHAERQGITLCLEHLNSRDGSHPMKGHPGYFGDNVDFCVDLIKRVGSDHLKLLFDIYHVSIMNGDIIRRIHQYKDLIAHYHTAGNPGRGELDETQEINYPAVIRKLLDVGYTGFLGHEFIPTRDPLAGLKQAVAACDV